MYNTLFVKFFVSMGFIVLGMATAISIVCF